jgi:RimJ/RimL family protein N-acetyltransferase
MPDEGFTELAGPRVTLRRFHPGDVAEFVAYRSSVQVARFQSWDAPFPREEGERFVRELANEHPDTPGAWFQFAVALRPAGQLIGDCAAIPQAGDSRQCEIGFTIAPQYQGHGYATEAVSLLLAYLFTVRGKHRITACCDPRNTASAALLERLGMRREGHLRQSTWAKGEWTDDLVYALLHDEWQSG